MKHSFNLLLSTIILCGVLCSCAPTNTATTPASVPTETASTTVTTNSSLVSTTSKVTTTSSTAASSSFKAAASSSTVASSSFKATTSSSKAATSSTAAVTSSTVATTSSTVATAQPTHSTTAPAVVEEPEYSEMERRTLELVNEAREQHGLAPLKFNSLVYQCAKTRVEEVNVLWSHTRPDGRPWYTAITDCKAEVHFYKAAENLCKGGQTAESMMQALMNSEGHRKNILNPAMSEVAICIIPMQENPQYYVMVQLFLKPKT